MKKLLILCSLLLGCSTMEYRKTVDYVDIQRFMGKWHVIAGRLTFLEKGAHNAVEVYKWNEEKNRIDVEFTFNKNSFDGELKEYTQKAWIENKQTNAYWKVQPIWPLKLDYLVVDLDKDYQWVVIGVPSQDYAWIMSKDWQMSDETLNSITTRLKALGYSTESITRVPQKW